MKYIITFFAVFAVSFFCLSAYCRFHFYCETDPSWVDCYGRAQILLVFPASSIAAFSAMVILAVSEFLFKFMKRGGSR